MNESLRSSKNVLAVAVATGLLALSGCGEAKDIQQIQKQPQNTPNTQPTPPTPPENNKPKFACKEFETGIEKGSSTSVKSEVIDDNGTYEEWVINNLGSAKVPTDKNTTSTTKNTVETIHGYANDGGQFIQDQINLIHDYGSTEGKVKYDSGSYMILDVDRIPNAPSYVNISGKFCSSLAPSIYSPDQDTMPSPQAEQAVS